MAAILGILSSIFGGSIAHIEHVHHSLNLPDMTQHEMDSHAREEIKKYNSHCTTGGAYAIAGGAYAIAGGGRSKVKGGNWFQEHTRRADTPPQGGATPFGGNGNVKGGDYVISGGDYVIRGGKGNGGNQRKMTMADLTK